MLDIKDIVQKYRDRVLTRDNDGSGAGGVWDYAGEIVTSMAGDMAMGSSEFDLWRETIYNTIQDVLDLTIT